MKQKKKAKLSPSSFISKNKFLFIILILGLIFFNLKYSVYKQEQPDNPLPNTASPSKPLEKLTYEIPANWKTYTTNKIMNIHPEILQKHPGIQLPTLSFQYPPTWHVETVSGNLTNMDFKFPLLMQIRKIHPKNGKTHSVEGLLADNVGFDMRYGVTPDNLKEFDAHFWGGGNAHIFTKSFDVDGKQLTLGYSDSLVTALYHISHSAQLFIFIDFANSDTLCKSQYCRDTTEEIKQILSSFRFSDFTKTESRNRVIPTDKSCRSDSDCKVDVCACESFNQNHNTKGCFGTEPFCLGKAQCVSNQCLFLSTEADRP